MSVLETVTGIRDATLLCSHQFFLDNSIEYCNFPSRLGHSECPTSAKFGNKFASNKGWMILSQLYVTRSSLWGLIFCFTHFRGTRCYFGQLWQKLGCCYFLRENPIQLQITKWEINLVYTPSFSQWGIQNIL